MTATNLFETGSFRLHSGDETFWRINAEMLSNHDVATLAGMYAHYSPGFQEVVGVPRGGLSLAYHLRRYEQPMAPTQQKRRVLVVDDVLTTGSSMAAVRRNLLDSGHAIEVQGVVIFARGRYPGWITAIWRLPGHWMTG